MAKSTNTTLRLSKRNKPKAIPCETRFRLTDIILFLYLNPYFLFDTASTVKLISRLMKNSTTPKRNNDA